VFQEVDLAPGGFTGSHTHRGPLLVVVKTGTLTHLDARCDVQTYAEGQAFIEPAGKEHVHMGQNLGGWQKTLKTQARGQLGSRPRTCFGHSPNVATPPILKPEG